MGDDFPQKTKNVKAGDQWHGFRVLGDAEWAAGWDLSCLPTQHRPQPGTHATDHLLFPFFRRNRGLEDELVGEASWPRICVVRPRHESDSACSIGSRPGAHCLAESPNRMWKRQRVRVVVRRCLDGRAPRCRLPWRLPRVGEDGGLEVAKMEVLEELFIAMASRVRLRLPGELSGRAGEAEAELMTALPRELREKGLRLSAEPNPLKSKEVRGGAGACCC